MTRIIFPRTLNVHTDDDKYIRTGQRQNARRNIIIIIVTYYVIKYPLMCQVSTNLFRASSSFPLWTYLRAGMKNRDEPRK